MNKKLDNTMVILINGCIVLFGAYYLTHKDYFGGIILISVGLIGILLNFGGGVRQWMRL
jgi:hypothetical protein